MTTEISKPGKHGTLHLFVVSYQDRFDAFNRGVIRTWAYDAEHAEEKFYDSDDADGWEVTTIKKDRGSAPANRRAGVPA